MGLIRIISDNEFAPHIGACTCDLQPDGTPANELAYMPHDGENGENVCLLKLRLYCTRHRIKLLALGHLNQLPEFSVLADKVILQTDDHLLNQLYGNKTTRCHTDARLLRQFTTARFIRSHRMSAAAHNSLLNRDLCDPSLRAEITPELLEEHATIIAAMNEVDDQEVIDHFTWPDVYVRQSTWELFQQLDLPANIIFSEAKHGWAVADRVRQWLDRSGLPDVRGLDQVFQHELLKQVGAHFMSIQFLASWLKNWMFFCVGGSANLFSVLPVKCLVMFDTWFKNASTETCLRGLARGRYGELGSAIPVFLPHRPTRPIEAHLTDHLPEMRAAVSELASIGYGGQRDSRAMLDFQGLRRTHES